MQAVKRPYVLAAAALAATSLVAATPLVSKVATRAAVLPNHSFETNLVDSSIFNIPFNLFQDIVNIPYNEVQALNGLADSEFFTGNWFVVSATNLWGVDPGDPSHFMSVANLLFPFPELSGMGQPETAFDAGLGQQLWGLVAAEIPVNSGCDAMDCIPQVPTPPITGITSIDSLIWDSQILSGQQQFPLLDSWFQVSPQQLLDGYYFSPDLNGSTDPSGAVVPGFGLLGTGAGDAMPWSGDTYTFEPWVPFENFFNSLEATPDYSAFDIPSLTDAFQAFQAVIAGGLVDFDPITAGSPFCPGTCDLPEAFTYPALVQDVANLMPGNPIINEWLTAYDNGAGVAGIDYNGPTEAQILRSVELLQQGYWDFGNPYPPAGTGPDYTQTAQFFYQLWTDLGITPGQGTDAGGAAAVAASSSLDPSQLTSELNAMVANLAPAAMSTDLSALLAGLEPAALSADFSALAESFASTLSAEFAAAVPATLAGLF
jgi:hypothetical protein